MLSDYSEILREQVKKKSKEKRLSFKQLLPYPNISNKHNYKPKTIIIIQLRIKNTKKQ